MLAVLLTNLIFSVGVSSLINDDLLRTITLTVVGQAVTAGLVYFSCFVRDVTNRFLATITAILGCDLIITALIAPVLVFINPQNNLGLGVLGLVFVFWSIAINGHILHRSLNIPLMIGILVALGINILSVAMNEVTVGL